MNKYRKFVTTGVGFTFVVVGSTGVIFQFFFKSHFLEKLHGWLGVAMVAVAIIHIIQNWVPLRNHFRDRRVFGLLIPIGLLILLFGFGSNGKGGREREGGRGMNPREVFFKLSQAKVNDVAKVFGKDLDSVLASMKNDGLHVQGSGETLQAVAQANQRPPEAILVYFVK